MPLVEKRYAEALIDLAVQHGNVDLFLQEFGSIVDAVNSQSEFRQYLLDPEVKTAVKKETVKSIFGKYITPDLLNFILLVMDKGRMKYLTGMFKEFVILADKVKNILNMTVISAVPMEQAQIDQIKESYRQKYNANAVKASVEIDSALIGGVKVVIGDKVIDGSLKGRLEDLMDLLVQ